MYFRLDLNEIGGHLVCKVSFVKSILYKNKTEHRNKRHI